VGTSPRWQVGLVPKPCTCSIDREPGPCCVRSVWAHPGSHPHVDCTTPCIHVRDQCSAAAPPCFCRTVGDETNPVHWHRLPGAIKKVKDTDDNHYQRYQSKYMHEQQQTYTTATCRSTAALPGRWARTCGGLLTRQLNLAAAWEPHQTEGGPRPAAAPANTAKLRRAGCWVLLRCSSVPVPSELK